MIVATHAPSFNTGILRYDFQLAVVRKHHIVLNIGCNEDPAHLRQQFGPRIINCDRSGWDEHMNRPNHVDRIFDCLVTPWPFGDDEADLALFGDILEHFPPEQSIAALKEAHRVARHVAVTVPEDTRIDEAEEQAKWSDGVYNLHTTTVTSDLLGEMLTSAGWELDWLAWGLWGKGGDWGPDGIMGWCAHAHRAGAEQ